jgi:hypothetical protein
MSTDPESLDEVRDPIAEDEVEVVETGDLNEREEGEETVAREDDSDVDPLEDPEPDSLDETEVTIDEADGPETNT